MAETNRYSQIIERIFLSRYREGDHEVPFERDDIITVAQELGIILPKNLGDVIFEMSDKGLAISSERHYRLVSPDDLPQDELNIYRTRPL